MRVATMVIALALMIVLFIQSCAVYFGGSIGEDEDMAGGGAVGMFVALIWVVGAGLVLGRPKGAVWAFGVAAFFGLIGATAGGFPDLWIWTVASVILALMSWRGIKEKEKKEAEDSERYQADIAAAAAQVRAQEEELPAYPAKEPEGR